MTLSDFLDVAAPVLLVTLLGMLGIFLIVQLRKESRREAERGLQIIAHLRCPACGSAYDHDQWDGATWGIDADPPESAAHDHGILLVCPHCHTAGYVVEEEGSLQIVSTPEEAAGLPPTRPR